MESILRIPDDSKSAMKTGVDSLFHRTFLFALISVGNFLEHKTLKSSLQNKNVLPKNEKSMYNEANAVDKRHIYDDD